jgi:hypothetical protein
MHAVADPFAALTDEERELLRAAPRPDWVEPMKAVLTDERFSRAASRSRPTGPCG